MIDCSKCPDKEPQSCCGIMIFPKEFVEKFKDKIEQGHIEIIEKEDLVTFLYNDTRCPFLDRITRLCNIYENRPDVCKRYGIDVEKLPCLFFKPSGNRRSLASQTKMERIHDKNLKKLEKMNGNKDKG